MDRVCLEERWSAYLEGSDYATRPQAALYEGGTGGCAGAGGGSNGCDEVARGGGGAGEALKFKRAVLLSWL